MVDENFQPNSDVYFYHAHPLLVNKIILNISQLCRFSIRGHSVRSETRVVKIEIKLNYASLESLSWKLILLKLFF